MAASAALLLVILEFSASRRTSIRIRTRGAKRSTSPTAFGSLCMTRLIWNSFSAAFRFGTLDDELGAAGAAFGLRLLGKD